MTTLTLKQPLRTGLRTIKALTFRDPSVGEIGEVMRFWQKDQGEAVLEQFTRMIALMTGLKPKQIDRLCPDDYVAATEVAAAKIEAAAAAFDLLDTRARRAASEPPAGLRH